MNRETAAGLQRAGTLSMAFTLAAMCYVSLPMWPLFIWLPPDWAWMLVLPFTIGLAAWAAGRFATADEDKNQSP